MYDEFIGDIVITKDELIYGTKEAYVELEEKDIILYDELDKLAIKVKEVMETIRKEEVHE